VLAGEQLYFYHNDHLGTPQVMTDEDQIVVWVAEYRPFGEVEIVTAKVENNLRFPGQYFDQESGLHYNYYRDYDPSVGRYAESDPIGLDGGLNSYAYVGANPVKWVDPYGLYGLWLWGNPLGGSASGPATINVPTVNTSIGSGGAGMFLVNYLSADSGVAIDSAGNICFYSSVCNGVGWNDPVAGELGIVGSVGVGELCTGQTETHGVFATGALGGALSGQILSNGSIIKGLVGVGGSPVGPMSGAGALTCTTTYECL
jgi:RHS repeat-associated protein